MKIPDTVCFLDLETLPEDATVGMKTAPGWEPTPLDELAVEPKRRSVPASYKKYETIRAWEAREDERMSAALADAWLAAAAAQKDEQAEAWQAWSKGSLNALKGRIACIAIAFGEGDVFVIECAEDEARGLRGLDEYIRATSPRAYVAHNGIGFDFPWLQLRAMKYGYFDLARIFHQDKPWDGLLIDTKRLWPGASAHKGPSLNNVCAFLGIDHSEGNPINGSEVLAAYVEGRWSEVVEHGRADVRDLREVYRALSRVRGDL